MKIVDAQLHLWSSGVPSGQQCVTMFTAELPWLTGRELELVMGGGICKWLGWDLAG